MEGPLVTAFAGIYMSKAPWKKAHEKWFEDSARELDNPELLTWIGKKNYWPGVFEVAEKKFPHMNKQEQTVWARTQYFQYVKQYIADNHITLNEEVFEILEQVQIPIVITSSTPADVIQEILTEEQLQLFSAIHTLPYEATEENHTYFEHIIEEHGLPQAYLGTDYQESLTYWTEKDIPVAAAQLDDYSSKLVDAEILRTEGEVKNWLRQYGLIT